MQVVGTEFAAARKTVAVAAEAAWAAAEAPAATAAARLMMAADGMPQGVRREAVEAVAVVAVVAGAAPTGSVAVPVPVPTALSSADWTEPPLASVSRPGAPPRRRRPSLPMSGSIDHDGRGEPPQSR